MKRQMVLALLALLMAAPASATMGRDRALGGGAQYTMGDSDSHVFPQAVARDRNIGIVELGSLGTTNMNRTGGVHVYLPNLEVDLGVYVNQPNLTTLLDGFSNVGEDARTAEVILAKDNWGISAFLGGDDFKDDEIAEDSGALMKEHISYFGFGGGITLGDWDDFASELGLHVHLGSGKREFEAAGEAANSKSSGVLIRCAIRNWYQRSDNRGRFVAIGSVVISSGKDQGDGPDDTDEDKEGDLFFGVGLGWEYPASDDVLVILAIEPFRYEKYTFESITDSDNSSKFTNTILSIPSLHASIEAEIKSWLIGRAGISQSWGFIKDEQEVTSGGDTTVTLNEKMTEAIFVFSTGAKIIVSKNFWADVVLNDRFFQTGPDFISGVGGNLGNAMFSYVSLGCNWN